jgi:hypothetical protein
LNSNPRADVEGECVISTKAAVAFAKRIQCATKQRVGVASPMIEN